MKKKPIEYLVSDNPMLLAKEHHITPEVEKTLIAIFDDVMEAKDGVIEKLTELALKYPKVPQFKSQLATVYQKKGNIEKAYEANKWIVAEHPKYLFGLLNLANESMYRNEDYKVPEILGETLELHDLYPERKEFHIEEVMSFLSTTLHYFTYTKKFNLAKERLKLMIQIDPEHRQTKNSSKFLKDKILEQKKKK